MSYSSSDSNTSYSRRLSDDVIYVTQPSLPPFEEFTPYLKQVWNSRKLTNCGPFHQELEHALCDFLGVEYISLFANGTLALVTALQALRITGEVITTPFSFVATSHSLLWNENKPVFVDIDPETMNIDPSKIESAITPRTTAILAVHCYGHPCDVDAIELIANTYNLKVIYDAAHAFGVDCHCGSLLKHGDLSVLSFHATKVFNTFEGGAIICHDLKTKSRIDQLKNFGHSGETNVVATGINGKMCEFNAALGLLQLKYVNKAIEERQVVDACYRDNLAEVNGIHCHQGSGQLVHNYAYFPIRVNKDFNISRDALYDRLKKEGVHPRKYFYPLISEFPMYRGLPSSDRSNLPVASQASLEILCLPIYPGLSLDLVVRICEFIKNC
jgi:dTDP-4-amino-4,6-dideoxygalactose transaminase